MSDLDEALRLARSLPAVNVNAWVDPNALLLARALIAVAAENERLTNVVSGLASSHVRLGTENERLRAVYEKAERWFDAGGRQSPCGEPGCRCTECELAEALACAERPR